MNIHVRRSVLLVVLAAVALAMCAAPGISAQSTLSDGSCVVMTQAGLFLVAEGQTAVQVFDATPFGGGPIDLPSVAWIDGTNDFIVTRRNNSGKGGIWRVKVLPSGAGTVTDLTPAIPATFGHDFADADYSVGLDTLFVIEKTTGELLADLHPATSTGASFAHWASLPPDTGVALAVRGALFPFSILVVQATGEIVSVNPAGLTGLNVAGNPNWSQVSTNPWSGAYYVASQALDEIAQGAPDLPSGLPTALIDLNVWLFCGPLVQEPLDIAWDARKQRVVGLAGDLIPDCAFGPGVATGKNHIVRLPLAAFGPPGAQPVLVTGTGDSGIVGKRSDFALVRHGIADITWYGSPGSGAGTSTPVFGGSSGGTAPGVVQPLFAGQAATEGVAGAPPSAAATLVIGLSAVNGTVQGQLFGPKPDILFATSTSAQGVAQQMLFVPAAAPAGLHVYMQWWFSDTTTPAGGDLVSSQVGIFTVGTP